MLTGEPYQGCGCWDRILKRIRKNVRIMPRRSVNAQINSGSSCQRRKKLGRGKWGGGFEALTYTALAVYS
jgi:hypothetical protein